MSGFLHVLSSFALRNGCGKTTADLIDVNVPMARSTAILSPTEIPSDCDDDCIAI